jgi:hypothetical protein
MGMFWQETKSKKMYNFSDKIKMNKMLRSWKIQLVQIENQFQ